MIRKDEELYPLVQPTVKEVLSREVKESDTCLEIGCGPGQYELIIPGKYIGLDLTSEDYNSGLPRKVDIVADGQALPFKENSFEVVFIVATFLIIPDTEQALKEIYRVLKNGGKCLIFDYNLWTSRRLRKQDKTHKHIWTPWRLKKAVKNIGFQTKTVYSYGWHNRPKWLRTLLSSRVIAYLVFLIKQLFFEGWNIIIGLKKLNDEKTPARIKVIKL